MHTNDEFEAMSVPMRKALNTTARKLKDEREEIKKAKAEVQDVQDSLKDISEAIPDVDLSKAAIIAKILFQNLFHQIISYYMMVKLTLCMISRANRSQKILTPG